MDVPCSSCTDGTVACRTCCGFGCIADFVVARVDKGHLEEKRVCEADGQWLGGIGDELPNDVSAPQTVPDDLPPAVRGRVADWVAERSADLEATARTEFHDVFGQVEDEIRFVAGKVKLRAWAVELKTFRWRYVHRRLTMRTRHVPIPRAERHIPIPLPATEAGDQATEGSLTVISAGSELVALRWNPKPYRPWYFPFVIRFKSPPAPVD
jgi:hypothetical protein